MRRVLLSVLPLTLLPVVAFAASGSLLFTVDGVTSTFADVDADAWYAPSVRAAAEAKIVSGYEVVDSGAKLFGPRDAVTLAQALKMAVLSAGLPLTGVPDVYPSSTHWAKPYLNVAFAHTFATFVGANEKIDDPATRLEVARMLADAFGLTAAYDPAAPALPSPFRDVSANGGVWEYAVLRLARDGVITGDLNADGEALGTFRPNDLINRAETMKIVMKAREVYAKTQSAPEPVSARMTIETALTSSGSWVKTLGEGPFTEKFVYTFSADGKYSNQLESDYPSSPVTGTWQLSDAADGIHLLLSGGKCYWLPCSTFVTYDETRNVLLVSGSSLVGVQVLEFRNR